MRQELGANWPKVEFVEMSDKHVANSRNLCHIKSVWGQVVYFHILKPIEDLLQYWHIPNRSTKRKGVYFWCGQKLLDAACVFQLIFDTKKEKYCTKNYQSFWHKENQFWYCKLKANQRRFKTVDTFVKSKLQKWCIGWPSYHWLPGNGQMGQNLCSTIHHRLWNIHHRTTTRNIDRIPDVSF